jgi:hypothetical protein
MSEVVKLTMDLFFLSAFIAVFGSVIYFSIFRK